MSYAHAAAQHGFGHESLEPLQITQRAVLRQQCAPAESRSTKHDSQTTQQDAGDSGSSEGTGVDEGDCTEERAQQLRCVGQKWLRRQIGKFRHMNGASRMHQVITSRCGSAAGDLQARHMRQAPTVRRIGNETYRNAAELKINSSSACCRVSIIETSRRCSGCNHIGQLMLEHQLREALSETAITPGLMLLRHTRLRQTWFMQGDGPLNEARFHTSLVLHSLL